MKSGVDTGTAVKALRLAPHQQFGKALNGFAAKLTPAQVKALSHNADVIVIERDAWHHSTELRRRGASTASTR